MLSHCRTCVCCGSGDEKHRWRDQSEGAQRHRASACVLRIGGLCAGSLTTLRLVGSGHPHAHTNTHSSSHQHTHTHLITLTHAHALIPSTHAHTLACTLTHALACPRSSLSLTHPRGGHLRHSEQEHTPLFRQAVCLSRQRGWPRRPS